MKILFYSSSLLIQIFLLSSASLLYAQNFVPLKLENVWVWSDQWNINRKAVLVDTNYIINNINYSKILYNDYGGEFSYSYFNNTDSLYYNYMPFDTLNNFQIPYYKLNCALGDTFSFKLAIVQQDTNIFPIYKTFEVIDVFSQQIFDTVLTIKVLHWNAAGLVEGTQLWTDELGMLYNETYEFGGVDFLLRGCVINGMVYGDTSYTVNIDDEPYKYFDFKLFQNYPNPFNPSTTISFNLPKEEFVELTIYDINGRALKVLVSEFMSAGNHSLLFEAKDFASGVYFYKIKTNSFSSTKKLILLR